MSISPDHSGADLLPQSDGGKVSQERLKHWVEQGFSQDAVAVRGISTESFQQLLRTGSMPATPLERQDKQFVQVGIAQEYDYYAFPILHAVAKADPGLWRTLQKRLDNKKISDDDRSVDFMRSSAMSYARVQGITDYFSLHTGIHIDESVLATIAAYVMPDRFEEINELQGYHLGSLVHHKMPTTKELDAHAKIHGKASIDEYIDQHSGLVFDSKLIEQLQSVMGMDKLKTLLDGALLRKGVVVYLNSGIFSESIIPGREDEREIIIKAKKPLQTDVISGVEIQSGKETAEILEAMPVNSSHDIK